MIDTQFQHNKIFWVLPLLLLALAGCNHEATGTPAGTGTGEGGASKGSAVTVTVVKPVQKKLQHKVEQPGEIQAFEQTPLVAKISGFVDKVYKDIGDEVKVGEVLVRLAVPEMDEELKQKEALAKQAQSEEERARKLAGAAEAFVKVAEAKIKETAAARQRAAAELTRAQSQYDRLKQSTGVVAAEVIEETKLGFEAARANLVEAEARVKSAESAHVESESKRDTAKSEIAVAEARFVVAKAAVRGQVELLKYAQLKAPFTGVVTRRTVDVGHFLQANPSGKGEAVMVVASMDPVRIFVDVPENDAVLVGAGARAVVRVQALKGEEFEGAVKRTAWALDPKNRTLRTEVDLPNPERRLRPGMYAFATIHSHVGDAWVVPTAAVATHADKSTCFLALDGKAQQVSVQLGLRDGTNIQVRRKRMSADGPWQTWTGDEQVISPIPPGLADGQAVSTKAN